MGGLVPADTAEDKDTCSGSGLMAVIVPPPPPPPLIPSLSFPEEPTVTLSGKCRGEVRLNSRPVCSSNWTLDNSHLVCQEQQDCSNAVFFHGDPGRPARQLTHVACEDHQDKLGQCERYEGRCAGGPVSVYCVGTPANRRLRRFPAAAFVCRNFCCVVFQEASGSTPQAAAAARS